MSTVSSGRVVRRCPGLWEQLTERIASALDCIRVGGTNQEKFPQRMAACILLCVRLVSLDR